MTSGYIVLGRPDWTRPRLAPEGDRLAAIRWHDGAANVWIGASKAPMQLVSDLRPWRLQDFHWGLDGRGLVLVLDDAGVQRRALAWLDLRSGTVTRLTPERSADVQYAGQVGGTKPRILVSARHSLGTGSVLQAVTPTGEVVDEWLGPCSPASCWLASETQAVAVSATSTTCTWWHSSLSDPSWAAISEFPLTDGYASRPLAFSRDGKSLFATSTVGRDTVAVVRMSGPSWSPEVLSAKERFDITGVLMAPDGSVPVLVSTTDPDRPQLALSAEAESDLSRLEQLAGDAFAQLIGRNSTHCLAEVSYPVGGPAYVTFSRTGKAVGKPLARYTGLSRVRINGRRPFRFRSRDDRLLTGFITRPLADPPWPVVLAIHDGPWARDDARMDPWAQYLASAGFCCVQVNYRGSRGFGKEFRAAADGQWALRMQDDLVDALRSAPVRAVADPDRITAMGHGYGGYAALMLATQAEIPLAAVIAASAPTDLVRYTTSLMSFGGSAGNAYARRIGHPVDDYAKLMNSSPVARAADIGAPLLLFHGRQDTRVPVSQATAFADELRRARKQHELVVYEDEGHWYSRPQNISDFRLRTVEFLLGSLSPATDAAGV